MLPTSLFSWNPASRRFVAECSDIHPAEFQGQTLTIVSVRTRKPATFAMGVPARDRDGEVIAYILHPTPQTLREQPSLRGVTLHLLND